MGSVDGQPTAGMRVGFVHLTTKIAGMALVFAAALFLMRRVPYRLFRHVW